MKEKGRKKRSQRERKRMKSENIFLMKKERKIYLFIIFLASCYNVQPLCTVARS